MPSGWTLVGFSGTPTSCPSSATQASVYEGPDTSGVCGCGCSLTTQPTCPDRGPIGVMYDSNFNHNPLACNNPGSPAQMKNNTACGTDQYGGSIILGYKSLDLQYTPPGPTGGVCQSSAIPNTSKLTYAAQDTICTPNTEPCNGNECTPSFGSLDVCITASGSMACPASPSPFTHQHVVGGPATFSCSDSGCGCQVTATCTGTVTLYTSMDCTTTGGATSTAVPADGQCHSDANASSNTYASYSYTANNPPQQPACGPTGTSAAQNVAQPNVQTVCCTQ